MQFFDKLTAAYGQLIESTATGKRAFLMSHLNFSINTSDGSAYGLPIDSSHDTLGNIGPLLPFQIACVLVSDIRSIAWNGFTAAIFTNDTTRVQLLSGLWNYAASNQTSAAFSTIYNISSGANINGTSRLASLL